MKSLYKRVLCGCVLMLLTATGVCTEVFVPVAEDLQHTGRQARAGGLPILLTFSATDCSYCELLEEEFLRPMLLSGAYDDRIMIRKLLLDGAAPVRDFAGKPVSPALLSDRYRVFITPTILFVDADGTELAERITGINTLELFGGYLDECIDTAVLALSRPEAPELQPAGCRLQQNR